jgi:phosphatidylserine decarboxylase
MANSSKHEDPSVVVRHRYGEWLPQHQHILNSWLEKRVTRADQRKHNTADFHPVVQEFQALIETDADIWMGFHQMFEQVPAKPPYNNDPIGEPQV